MNPSPPIHDNRAARARAAGRLARPLRDVAVALALLLAVVCATGGPAAEASPDVAPAAPPGAVAPEVHADSGATAKARSRAQVEAKAERIERAAVVAFARAQLGKPYVWGAAGPRSFDCSGLIFAAYRSVGRSIPRTTASQRARLRTPHRLRAGDLAFGMPGHVAIYIGHGRVIHAPAPGRRIEIASSGWHSGYARRTVFG